MIHLLSREASYREDASGLFAALGGTTRDGTVLLESADISTKSGIASMAVLAASLRLTCDGELVRLEPLSPSGEVIAAELAKDLSAYAVGDHELRFPRAAASDERERLTAISQVEPLRRLQSLPELHGLPVLFGGMAFDFLDTFESLPTVPESANTFPDYQFVLAEVLLDVNHQDRTATLYAVAATDAERERLERLLDELTATIEAAEPGYEPVVTPAGGTLTARADIPDAEYRRWVSQLKGNIYEGDIYQVVPARSFAADCPDAFAAYRRLRDTNPSPYMFYLRGSSSSGAFELFGASPESNLKFDAATREVQLYPIAGTRPRGANHEMDIRNELDMRTDAKELAEHLMLVDLARNDLARVATPATRKVAGLLEVDRYSRVMHLVSRVTARLADDLDALDAYRACMNMGTLTGAPKLKAMELLRGVEKQRRGSYGGAVGYLRGGGDMDNCIVIRSAFVQDGTAIVQAGAGVVRDSDPQSEADETLHKAYAVLHALALAAGATLEVIR